ncbi:MAG: T9SS type A sorting domain-containing protein [Flavobacteriales bacterium]|nr:T9SS type A sorting domain-containing protein [Flavobacteriales bacterium]
MKNSFILFFFTISYFIGQSQISKFQFIESLIPDSLISFSQKSSAVFLEESSFYIVESSIYNFSQNGELLRANFSGTTIASAYRTTNGLKCYGSAYHGSIDSSRKIVTLDWNNTGVIINSKILNGFELKHQFLTTHVTLINQDVLLGGHQVSDDAKIGYGILVKLDTSDNPIWAKKIAGSGNVLVKKIIQTINGQIYIAGQIINNVTGNQTFLINCSDSGNLIWSKVWSFGYLLEAEDMALDEAGHLYIIGLTLSNSTLSTDGFIIKTDSSGEIIWANLYGGRKRDQMNSILNINNGKLGIVGNHERIEYSCQPSSVKCFDTWILEIDTNGKVNMGITVGRETEQDYGLSISVLKDQWLVGGQSISDTFLFLPSASYFYSSSGIGGFCSSKKDSNITRSFKPVLINTNISLDSTILPQCNPINLGNRDIMHYTKVRPFCTSDTMVSARNVEDDKRLKIYPNPSEGIFSISGLDIENSQYCLVSVFSVTGRLILENVIVETNQTLDLSSLDNGVYFLKIEIETTEHSSLIYLLK